jgi:hypothetical protein
MTAPASSPAPVSDRRTFWQQCRVTFGPVVVGLLGGGATGLLGLAATASLLRNCAVTYERFPSVARPALAVDLGLPEWLVILCAALGCTIPFAMGLATVLLVRPRDRWGDVAAGLTTGLSSTLAAYVAGIGWAVVLAMTVVPSIADLTLLGDATRTPAAAGVEQAAAPSAALAERYPELAGVAENERGGLFFAKIVADQCTGSAAGVWLGVLLALAWCGVLGFVSTLTAGYLVRRGPGLRAVLVPYLELTVAVSVMVGLVFRQLAGSWLAVLGGGNPGVPLLWLGWVTAVVVLAVVRRWHWGPRLTLALVWIVVLVQVLGEALPWYLAAAGYVAAAVVLVRQVFLRWQPAVAAA